MLKPHRVLMDKVSSYTDEAAAFMRRRRHHRRSYIRVQYSTGDSVELTPGTPDAAKIDAAANALIDLG